MNTPENIIMDTHQALYRTPVASAIAAQLVAAAEMNWSTCRYVSSFGVKISAAPLMQYRCPVGGGPSGNT